MVNNSNISRMENINTIQYLEDLFEKYTTEESVTATFLNGLLKDVVRDLHKKENYPAVILIEPVNNKLNSDLGSSIYKTVPIKMVAAQPTNWGDNSTDEIHGTTLSNLESIVFGFWKYLMDDLKTDEKKLDFNYDSYTHYALATKLGGKTTPLLDKVSAVEFTFNLSFYTKLSKCT